MKEGKQYPVLCRRLASLNEAFISHKSLTGGFDFISGKRIEQKLIDYNQETERLLGYAYEEVSEVSPHRRFIAYTMYDKDNDFFKLCFLFVASHKLIGSVMWHGLKGVKHCYTLSLIKKRSLIGILYKIYCSMLGSTDEDVMLLEEPEENVHVNIRHTKDFKFVTVYVFSTTYSKVFLINATDPLSGLTLVWECEACAHCIIEHHQGYLYIFTNANKEGQSVNYHYILRSPLHSSSPRKWENVFIDDNDLVIEGVDLYDTFEGERFRLWSVALPLPRNKMCSILKSWDYIFFLFQNLFPKSHMDQTMTFIHQSCDLQFHHLWYTPDAVVDYNLSNGKFEIIQQQNLLQERTCVLYGTASVGPRIDNKSNSNNYGESKSWNDLSEFYGCENHQVVSSDGVKVGLTIVYSHKRKKEGEKPGLLHGHGACGELLHKKWCNELKSLLDHGWILAYADARGGGGRGKKWHEDGRSIKKQHSDNEYISCAKFLINNKIIHQNKLAGWPLDDEIVLELDQMEKVSDIEDILSYKPAAELELQLCGSNPSEGVFVWLLLSMSLTTVVLNFLMEKNSVNALHRKVCW
uniref:Prolyl endopeptidase n=1 Tax=Lactuca sativa TaxID=4236 RepID=A0A9R1WJM4_LACSA|nr:hypothetical protein LSAT_V11C200082240 [Lactuca sativa]